MQNIILCREYYFRKTSATDFHSFSVTLQKNLRVMKENREERGPGLMRKYVWVLDTILRHHKISFKELNELWVDDDLSQGEELPKRTFDNWRNVIEDIFDIDIENENCGEYRYYIKDEREFRRDQRRLWLFDTFCVSNALANSQRIKDRVQLEYVPSGREFLQPIIEAMKENRVINITYHTYWRNEESCYDVEPYLVKLYRQRWYMIAKRGQMLLTFCLDRILDLQIKEETFAMPEDWSAENYFKNYFGVFVDSSAKPQRVLLKVKASQANYFRDLRLHDTQEEIETNEEYSIFRYFLCPQYDFVQELLWNGADVEVLEPLSLRDEMKEIVKTMWENYNKED